MRCFSLKISIECIKMSWHTKESKGEVPYKKGHEIHDSKRLGGVW
jgi:hypothetical protein